MTVGGVLGEAWDYYRRFFRRFVTVAAGIFVVLELLAAIASDARGKSAGLALAWGLVAIVAGLVGSFWVQGALVLAIDDVRDGRIDTTIEDLYRRTVPFLLPLLTTGIVVGVVVGVASILIVPGLFLLTRWLLAVPVIVLERRRPLDSLRRSNELVRGHGWTVFGIILLTVLLVVVAANVLTLVFAFLPTFAAVWIGGVVAYSLTVPFAALAWTVTYFELRKGERPTLRAVA